MQNEQSAVAPIKSVRSVRILCVEDDYDSGQLVQFLLSRENESYEVTVASTVLEAEKLISQCSFDLYILDYCLPSKSGVHLCRWIRETDIKTPILFYSAMGRRVDRETAIKAGADDYLVKPKDFEELAKRTGQLLNVSGNGLPESR